MAGLPFFSETRRRGIARPPTAAPPSRPAEIPPSARNAPSPAVLRPPRRPALFAWPRAVEDPPSRTGLTLKEAHTFIPFAIFDVNDGSIDEVNLSPAIDRFPSTPKSQSFDLTSRMDLSSCRSSTKARANCTYAS